MVYIIIETILNTLYTTPNEYRIKLLSGTKPTSNLHIKIKNELIKNNIKDFEQEKLIDYYHVDECNENLKLILEIQGNYWHANPKIFKDGDIIVRKNMTAKQIWRKDAIKKKFLENKGYKVFYI